MGAILGFAPGLLDPFIATKQAVLLLGASALAGAVAASALVAPRRSLVPRGAFEWLVLAWLAVAATSTLASVSPMRSLLGEPAQREGLLTLATFAVLALASGRAHRDQRERERTLDFFLLACAASAAYALVQHAGLDPITWVNPARYPAGALSVVRPAGTLGSAILLGVVLVPALAVTAVRLLAQPGRLRTLGPLAALLAAATLATLSRGAWLGAGVGIVVAVSLALAGRFATPAAALRALAIALAPAALWGAIVLRAPVLARLAESGDPAATSGPARAGIAQAALAIARQYPLLGAGPDTFGLLFPQFQPAAYARDAWVGLPVHAHSAALQLLSTTGLLGAISMLALMVSVLVAARARATRQPVAGAITAALAGLAAVASVEPLGLAGAATLAVFAGLLTGDSGPQRTELPDAPTRHAPLFGALLALAVCAAVFHASLRASASAGVARTDLEQSISAANATDLRAGAEAAQAAASFAPYDDAYANLASDLQLALARQLAAARDPAGAALQAAAGLDDAERAVHIEPLRAAAHQRVGTAEAMLATITPADNPPGARIDSARVAFARARRLAPRDPMLLVESCRAALSVRRGDWALVEADSLLALSPRSGTAWALRASALLVLGHTGEARRALDSAAVAQWEAGSERERATVDLARRTLGLDPEAALPAPGARTVPRSPARR